MQAKLPTDVPRAVDDRADGDAQTSRRRVGVLVLVLAASTWSAALIVDADAAGSARSTVHAELALNGNAGRAR